MSKKNAQNQVVTEWMEWRKGRGRTGYPVGTVPSGTQRYPVVPKGTHLYNKCTQRSEIYIINVAHVPQIYIINVPHVPQNWRETVPTQDLGMYYGTHLYSMVPIYIINVPKGEEFI